MADPHTFTAKTSLADADEVFSQQSPFGSGSERRTTWLQVWSNFIKAKADAVYAALAHTHALSDVEDQTIGLLGNLDGGDPDPVDVNDAAAVRTFINVEDGATADQTAQEIANAIDADATAEATLQAALGFSKRLDGYQAFATSGNLTTSELFKINEVTATSVVLTLPGSPFTGLTQGDWWYVLNSSSGTSTVEVATAGSESINATATNSITIPPGRGVFVFFNSATDPQFRAEDPQLVPLAVSTILGADSDDTAYRALSPAEARAVIAQPVAIGVACSDETTALTTGTAKATFRMPFAFTLTGVRATVTTAPTGSTLIVDINEGGTTIMTTNKLSIDATEKTSTTAATAAGITDTALADDAEITIDIDQVGSTVAGAGLKVWLIGVQA